MTKHKLRYSADDHDGQKVLPLRLFSSSVDGGYNDYVLATAGRNLTFTNLHFKSYFNGSITSIATENYNGIKSRMNVVGATSDREETYIITIDSTNITFANPVNRIVVDKNYPSIINTENKRQTTSSMGGNFNISHDFVNGIGADSKMWISEYTGSYFLQEVAYLSGSLNYELPTRSKNKAEIITRFSSPGSFDETSKGYNDFATGQYCVYSTINYRNKQTRKNNNKELEKHFDLNDLL
jgi:hypothetical protein